MGWVVGLVALVVLLAALWIASWWVTRRALRRRAHAGAAPEWYSLENPDHVLRIDEIRRGYAKVLSRGGEFADCVYKPAALLPYPKEEIRRALTALLDFAEGRRDSSRLDPAIRTPDVADTLRAALMQLNHFLDVPAEQIPREPRANTEFGLKRTRSP